MTTRRAKFTPPTSAPHAREREVTFGVAGGFHGGVPSQGVPNGFSPDVRNFVPLGGHITPRSGLSRLAATVIAAPVMGAEEASDVYGNLGGVASTTTRLWSLTTKSQTWSALSYLDGPSLPAHAGLSGNSLDYGAFETVFSPDLERMITVYSNNTNQVQFFEFSSSAVTFSDFTWVLSLESMRASKDITSISDRLVFFNVVGSAGTRWPTRVLWSARGNPLSYVVADGAGIEDLKDMRGAGQACVRYKDFLVLFSDVEIWRATPTFDDYAFRFDRVIDNIGCPYPRTIAVTPKGVVFLGRDFEVYLTDGADVVRLGPVEGAGSSRIKEHLAAEITSAHRAWGIYSRVNNRYELYYAVSASADAPTKALFYDFATQTWWPQTFAFGLSAGVEVNDQTVFVGQTSYYTNQDRRVNVFTSAGSVARCFSTQTSDVGATIDARWRSPGVKNATRKAHLKEVWIDADVDSASSGSVWVGSARSASVFTSERAVAFTTANDPMFVPVFSTDNAPAFEIRIADGGRPKIASFSATLQDASKF